ncbi:MAG: DJ-1/PfpI family protein [Treponema sp.]|jgi:4-methyl-5(b-hydroxyethyl)-thiazole monophosphate biosynthesis|nr:DJ-1/PfpI family protein [Treponema sp.]
MKKRALVLLANGFEEVEAITPIDYLRRAGVEALSAAVGTGGALEVSGARGVTLKADLSVEAALAAEAPWDAVLCPGGLPGAEHLAASPEVTDLLRGAAASGAVIGAICAAPALVLYPLGLLRGKRYTCYPGLEARVTEARHSTEAVVVDGALVTSRAAGTAGLFAQALVEALAGPAAAAALAKSVLLSP